MTQKVYVGFPTVELDNLLQVIISLPEPFCPQFFARGERVASKLDKIEDKERFEKFYSRARKSSFGLIGEKIYFEVQPNTFRDENRTPVYGYLFVSIKKGFAAKDRYSEILSRFLDISGVSFGYACEFEESSHRHRVKKLWSESTSGPKSTELTIGVDYSKYVPSLYWITAFEDSYLKQHSVDPKQLEVLAIETNIHINQMGKKYYIFRFYEESKLWKKYTDMIEGFCSENDSFFSMQRLKAQIEESKTDSELGTVIRPYS